MTILLMFLSKLNLLNRCSLSTSVLMIIVMFFYVFLWGGCLKIIYWQKESNIFLMFGFISFSSLHIKFVRKTFWIFSECATFCLIKLLWKPNTK